MNLVIDGSLSAVGGAVLTSVLARVGQRFPKFGAFLGFVKKEGPAIVKGVEQAFENIAHTPAGIAAEHALKKEVDQVSAQLRQAELVRLAQTGLHAFGQTLSTLSDTQKTALSLVIANSLPKDWNVSRKEVADALDLAQKAADDMASSSLFATANAFTAELQSQPAATAEVAQ